jgi:hypothetical protein
MALPQIASRKRRPKMAEANRAAGVWLELPQIQLVVEVAAKMIIQPFIFFILR